MYKRQILFSVLAVWLNVASAQEPNYILGPGDVLKINVYSNPDLSLEARVSEAGLISYPLIGQVMVGGLTTFAAEKRIAGLLEKRGFIKEPQVNVLVLQFQSKLVSVLGSVYKPGRYPLERTTNLADLLALVGGATPDGSDLITVTGASGKKEYDLHKLVNEPSGLKNIILNGGEVVYVCLLYTSGENSNAVFDNAFDEREVETKLDWIVSGKSRVNMRAAYLSREYDQFSIHDYSGLVGNIDYSWTPTGKLRLILSAATSLSSYQTTGSSYTRVNSLSISPLYAFSDKITMRAQAGIAERTFLSEGVVPESDRVDWTKRCV